MLDPRPVLVEVTDGVAHITLNRPDSGNALDIAMATALSDAVYTAAADEAARVLLLSGAGNMFCAGGDLRLIRDATDRGACLMELVTAAHRAARGLARLDKPVVAAVQGSAAGAGLSLVLLSDVVLATPSTKLITAYAGVGLTPDCGQSWLLPRTVGLGRALDLTLDPRPIDAEEAASYGLVSRVVDGALLLDEAKQLAERMARGPATALGRARALLREGIAAGFDAQLDREAETISTLAATEEAGALIDAVLAGGA